MSENLDTPETSADHLAEGLSFMRPKVLSRFREKMKRMPFYDHAGSIGKCDAYITTLNMGTDNPDTEYLTGVRYTKGLLVVTESKVVFLAQEPTDERDVSAVGAMSDIVDAVVAPLGSEKLTLRLKEIVGADDVMNIGVSPNTDVATMAHVKEALRSIDPSIQCKSIDCGVNARREKMPEEIRCMRKAQKHVDETLTKLPEYLYTGITECQLASLLGDILKKNGSYELSFDVIVAFGENSSLPHHNPSNRSLKDGENILIDCGAKLHGYATDITRNVWYGTTDTPQYKAYRADYEALRVVQEDTSKHFLQGARYQDIDGYVRITMGKRAKYFTHSTGHGVGLHVHELPNVSASSPEEDVVTAGDVVTNEPGFYRGGEYGIRIEDQMVVEASGTTALSLCTRELVHVSARSAPSGEWRAEKAPESERHFAVRPFQLMQLGGYDAYVVLHTENMTRNIPKIWTGFSSSNVGLVFLGREFGDKLFMITDSRYAEALRVYAQKNIVPEPQIVEAGRGHSLAFAIANLLKQECGETLTRVGVETPVSLGVYESLLGRYKFLTEDSLSHATFETSNMLAGDLRP